MVDVLLALALAALAAGTFVLLRRASRARRELAVAIHDQARRLDERCDVLQGHLEALALRQRIDHLADLVTAGEAEGKLPGAVARDLRHHVRALLAESLLEHPDV